MDINGLFEQQGMRDFTSEQRDTFINDGQQIRQLQQIVQARLAQTQIDGDKPGAAGRRARKLARKLGKVARHLEQAAAQIEAFNTAYVRDVLELPQRRVQEVERKELRRQRLGIAAAGAEQAVAKSLDDRTRGFNGTTPVGNPQVTPVQQAPQYNTPYPHQFAGGQQPTAPIGNIADVFPEVG